MDAIETNHEPESRESLVAQLAELERHEPDCECYEHSDGDWDELYCDYHRSGSDYNREWTRLHDAIAWWDAEYQRLAAAAVVSVQISESSNERKVA